MTQTSMFYLNFLKRLAYVLGILILLGLLLLQMLPFAVIGLAKYEFAKQGDGFDLHVGDWHWSPWRGELEILQLVVQHPNLFAEALEFSEISKLDSLRVQFEPWQLIHEQIHINELAVSGLQLAVHLQEEDKHSPPSSIQILGLTVPLSQAGDSSSTPAAKPSDPLVIRINKISMLDSQVNWQQDTNDRQPLHAGKLLLNDIQVGPFDTQESAPMQVDVALTLAAFVLRDAGNNATTVNLMQPLTIHVNGQLLDLHAEPSWQGDIVVSQLGVQLADETKLQFDSVNLNKLAIKLIEPDQLNASLQNLLLQGFSLTRKGHALASVGMYQISDVQYQPLKLTSGPMSYDQVNVDLTRLANGSLQGITEISASQNNLKPAETPLDSPLASEEALNPPNTNPFAIDIASLTQQGNNAIRLKDKSISPVYAGNLIIKELTVLPININAGETEKPMVISVVFSLDEYNEFNINALLVIQQQGNGDFYPQGNVNIKIKQLDMVPFNGYFAQAMGYHLEKGMLQLQADINIHDAQLKGEANILLRNAKFVPEDEKIIASLSKKIAMPVDLALDLLRDKNGNVNVSIPITGDLSNPDFGAGDIGAQLSQLVLQNAALHYLKMALQPYGLFLSLATYAGSELMAIRLDALSYQPLAFDLTQLQMAQLTKIVGMMEKKASLELQVCPFVSEQEVTSLANDWPALAIKRGANIKAFLADKKDLNGKPLAERITLCKPQKSEKPEVVLGFN